MFWYLIFSFINTCFGQIDCYSQSQCAGQDLTSSFTVTCYGFDSCSNASTITAEFGLNAYGAYSAYNARQVISEGSSDCYGESSCRGINIFQTRHHTLCYATKSCFNTNITRHASSLSGSHIRLTGYKSGAYSTINLYQSTKIYADGSLSLYNTTINMYKSSTIYADQAFSLSGTNIYCENGETCTIYCFNYGCANILYC